MRSAVGTRISSRNGIWRIALYIVTRLHLAVVLNPSPGRLSVHSSVLTYPPNP